MSELNEKWEVIKDSPLHKGDARMISVRAVNSPLNHSLACVGMDNNPVNEQRANLIAAAPELLEACKSFMAWEFHSPLDDDQSMNDEELLNDCTRKIVKAIAKAENK